MELELFWKGEFSIGEDEEHDVANSDTADENEEPKEDAEGGKELLKKEDPEAGTVGKEGFISEVALGHLSSSPQSAIQSLT